MVTLSDVAREAGVSLSTASRAINGSRNRVVQPDLAARVLEAAERLNYSPNAAAQAMARGRTTMVGLIVHDITDPYFSSIAVGVARQATVNGCAVSLAMTHRDHQEQLALINLMRHQRAQALVLAGGLWDDKDYLDRLADALRTFVRSTGSNVAIIGQDRLATNTVMLTNADGSAALADALLGLGYRSFSILTGPEGHLTARDRADGFRRGLAGRGTVLSQESGGFDRDGGYEAMTRVLAGERPQAVFAVNDVMAVGALAAARDLGVRVPQDIAVAGFDDIPTLRDVTPSLTTVRAPLEKLGERAVELALQPPSEQPQVIELPTVVELRESTPRL